MEQMPRTQVEGISLSRMIIGTNWLAGWSHTSPSADNMIKKAHAHPESVVPILETFQEAGVDTIMAPFSQVPVICRAVEEASEKTGKKFIMIDTPHHKCGRQSPRREKRLWMLSAREKSLAQASA